MKKIDKNSFGLPQAVLPIKESLNINKIKKAIGEKTTSDMDTAIMLNIISELAGTFKFITDDESLLLQENQFFTNLILTGNIFVSKQNPTGDKFEFYNVCKVEKNIYQEIEKISVKPLQDWYITNSSSTRTFNEIEFTYDNETKLYSGNGVEPFQGVFINWNNTSYSFFVWAYPFVERMIRTHNQIDLSMRIANKKFLLRLQNRDEQVASDLHNSIEDTDSAFVIMSNPEIYSGKKIGTGDMNILEEFKTTSDGMNVKTAMEYLQFLRDSIGMTGSAQPIKAERNINAEFEVSDRNTNAYEETIMRNLKRLEKFLNDNGVVIEIVKDRDTQENNKEQETQQGEWDENIY
ncbi:MAG: hypothetical protein ACRCUM_02330 [Mycoplasmoidaceae bacterium]